MDEERIDIYGYLTVLVNYRRFIFFNLLAVCIIVAIISFLLPPWYTARTTILPPEKEGSLLSLSSSLLGGLIPSPEMSLPFMATPSDILATILRSRAVGEKIIEKEDLKKVYKAKTVDDALKELTSHLKIVVGREGVISLEFEDKDKVRASRVANLFVEELDEINRKTNASQAKNTRIFVEERLAQTQKYLTLAEENLKSFKEKNKAIALDEQMKAIIQGAADLKAQLVLDEIQLNVLKRNMSDSHPQVQQLRSKINEIEKQLDLLELGNSEKTKGEGKALDVPFSKVPALSLELARLTREEKIQEAVFELLTQQYEQAKIQEAKDTPTIQVLDKASPPERRSRPKRAASVGIAAVASLFLSVIFVFGVEYLKNSKTRNPEGFKKMENLFLAFNEDIKELKKLFLLSKK
jgi:tyrosine-protein kinase Etk/Wzc